MDRAGFNCTRAENRKFRVIVGLANQFPFRPPPGFGSFFFGPMTWTLGPLNGLQLTLIPWLSRGSLLGRYLQIAQENEIHTP
jgi:hypothetical protein